MSAVDGIRRVAGLSTVKSRYTYAGNRIQLRRYEFLATLATSLNVLTSHLE